MSVWRSNPVKGVSSSIFISWSDYCWRTPAEYTKNLSDIFWRVGRLLEVVSIWGSIGILGIDRGGAKRPGAGAIARTAPGGAATELGQWPVDGKVKSSDSEGSIDHIL